MNQNPYQPPVISKGLDGLPYDPAEGDALAIRQAHIKHEASVKSIGILYYLGAIIVTLAVAGSVIQLVRKVGGSNGADVAAAASAIGESLVMLILLIPLAILQWLAAYGIRRLLGWARIMGIVVSTLGLVGFPIGTIINAYIIYLLACKKGRTVFSSEYKEIIAVTPEVRYKTSKLVWIVLGLLLLVILFAVGMAAFASYRSRL